MKFSEVFLNSKIFKLSIKFLKKSNKPVTFENILNTMILIRNYCIEYGITYDDFERLMLSKEEKYE